MGQNDYFSVENAKLKHDGFYVNRGKLEQEQVMSNVSALALILL